MTSPLVTDVRDRIRSAERPLTLPERAQLAATVMKPAVGGRDALDELRDAIAAVRRTAGPALAADEGAALRRLLAAAGTFLDYAPDPTDAPRTAAAAHTALAAARGQAAASRAGAHWSERADFDPRPATTAVEADAELAWANAR